ncbi:MAG: hypothetical protein U1A78_40020 [Polyangia bacterium]
MWKVYVGVSLAVFALASLAALATALSPPEQHGRGMGAALLAGYVMLAWIATAANLAVVGAAALLRRKNSV